MLRFARRIPKLINSWDEAVDEGAWKPLQEARGSGRLGRSRSMQPIPTKVGVVEVLSSKVLF